MAAQAKTMARNIGILVIFDQTYDLSVRYMIMRMKSFVDVFEGTFVDVTKSAYCKWWWVECNYGCVLTMKQYQSSTTIIGHTYDARINE